MNILVTGGCGFVGSNLVRALVARGDRVTVLDNLRTGLVDNLGYVDKLIIGDICDIKEAENYDVIYHLAALARIQPSFRNPLESHTVNSFGTVNVLEYARIFGGRVVYAGSSSCYHDIYANHYTYTKWLGEQHCVLYNRMYSISTVIGRFFNCYGPHQLEDGAYATVIGIFEKQKREGKRLTVTGTGEKRRDFSHVDDIVNGLMIIGDRSFNGEVFNFGTGTNYSINEVAAMFKSEIEYIPQRPGEALVTLADISDSVKLGWKPKWKLPEYVDLFLASLST